MESTSPETHSPRRAFDENDFVETVVGIHGSLKNWVIFSMVPSEIIATVKLCCVFGKSGSEALMVTDDDEVLAFGTNSSCCLGLGSDKSSLVPRRIPELSKKKVKSFAFGAGPHVLALTENGEVYGWGDNSYGQVGKYEKSEVETPILVLTDKENPIVEVACGGHRSVARTATGQIYIWGDNQFGQLGIISISPMKPHKVCGLRANLKCSGISCGKTSTVAVFSNGQVHAWGSNENGQLGLGSLEKVNYPTKVSFDGNVIIQKVACGYSHTLALSDEGLVFAWGTNSSGQLGIGNNYLKTSPVQLETFPGRVTDIAATHCSDISAAMLDTGKIYMWGQCRGQAILKPLETTFESVQDVFAVFSLAPVTPVPIIVEPAFENQMKEVMRKQFDNPAFSDLKFIVEGKSIFVHRTILKIQCEYFRTMFNGNWAEDKTDAIEVKDRSYNVYRAFLQYFYTDQFDVPATEAVELLDLANFCHEDNLKARCERLIKNSVTVKNCAALYAAASRYQVAGLENFCFRFAMNHTTAVVQSEGFLDLPSDIVQKFFQQAARYGAFKQ